MAEYKYETGRLFSNLDIFEVVEDHCEQNGVTLHCWIAGGAIRNVFTNSMKDLNDYDIYFKSKEDLKNFLFGIQSTEHIVLSKTDKAITIKSGDAVVQLIFFKYFNSAKEIFDTFDFTCVMGAYNIHEDKFELHEDFLKDNASRMLRFNPGTAFPLMSMLRVFKYEKKGYIISKPEFVRILLKCMSMKITTIDEFKVQIGGMYGEAFENMVLPENTEFSYETMLENLKDLHYDDNAFKNSEFAKVDMSDYADFVYEVLEEEIPYFTFAGTNFGYYGNELRRINVSAGDSKYKKVSSPDSIKYLYKWVKKLDDGRYVSFFDNSFEYKIGEIAKPKNERNGSLYFSFANSIMNATYSTHGGVILECEYDVDDIKGSVNSLESSSLELKSAKPIREASLDEVKKIGGKVVFKDDNSDLFDDNNNTW